MRAWAGVTVAADATITGRSGGILSVTAVSAGIYEITLATNYGLASSQCACNVTEVGTLAASGSSSFAVNHVSNTVKRVSCLREGATGAASALTNMPFAFAMHAYGFGDNVP